MYFHNKDNETFISASTPIVADVCVTCQSKDVEAGQSTGILLNLIMLWMGNYHDGYCYCIKKVCKLILEKQTATIKQKHV